MRLWLPAVLLLAARLDAAETAQFLRIQPSPRPMAMAEAYTAVADDVSSLGTNPSGLSRLTQRQAAFAHAELYGAMRYDFAGYAHPFGSAGTGAVAVQRLAQSGIEGRGADRSRTGSFGASDMAMTLAFSRSLPGSSVRAGAAVKLLDSRLADRSARSAAFDLGLQAPVKASPLPLTVGLSVLNLGQAPRLGSERGDLPTAVALGGAVRVAGVALLSADVRHRPATKETSFQVGTEYAVLPAVALRAGYSALGRRELGAGPLGGLGLGLGLKVNRFVVDYAFSPAGELGNAQRLGFSTRF